MITHASTYGSTHSPSLSNAILHHKSKELNADCAPGKCWKLKVIQEEVDNDLELNTFMMNKACKKELIDNLIKHRILKSQGSRSNNRALAVDAHQNIKAITVETRKPFLCTGVHSFAFFSCSHVEDTTTASDNTVMKFFPEVLKVDYTDVLPKFEMYSCLKNRIKERKEHDQKLANAWGKGVVIGKKRKERSGKGKPRIKDKGQQSKKTKTSQLPLVPMYKSAEFINDEGDNLQDDNDDSNESGSGKDD
ncbi:hypothetical protein C0992_002966 [Termitomyces sp. T32_za158]|nr:hypothetical protein C0992_002966 [Termitomyces sp. T32_za158]